MEKVIELDPSNLSEFFSLSLDMLCVANFEGYFVKINPAWSKTLGWSLEELCSKPYVEFTHPDDREATLRESSKLISGQNTVHFENRYLHRNGQYRWISWSATANLERKIVYAIARDVTESKESKQTLQTLFAMIQESRDVFGYADPTGKILFLNKTLQQELGWSTGYQDIERYLSPGEYKRLESEIKQLKNQEGWHWEGEVLLRSQSSQEDIPYLLSLFALKGEKTRVGYYAILGRDLRARKKWEVSMQNSSKMSSLGEMAGGIAHEINNPLAIIIGKLRQMRRKATQSQLSSETTAEDLQHLERTAERIARIIRGLMTFSRDSDNDPLETIRVRQVVEDTLELCHERFRHHGITLSIDVPDDLEIEARASQMSQVLMNLLSNAFDAIDGLFERWIKIEASLVGENVEIVVADSGLGVPQKIVGRLMQPFVTSKEVGKGTGLGLSISKGIAENHGGELIYDATAPHTRFVMRLPVRNRNSLLHLNH